MAVVAMPHIMAMVVIAMMPPGDRIDRRLLSLRQGDRRSGADDGGRRRADD
jgi:hypothetical protein